MFSHASQLAINALTGNIKPHYVWKIHTYARIVWMRKNMKRKHRCKITWGRTPASTKIRLYASCHQMAAHGPNTDRVMLLFGPSGSQCKVPLLCRQWLQGPRASLQPMTLNVRPAHCCCLSCFSRRGKVWCHVHVRPPPFIFLWLSLLAGHVV